VGDLELVAAGDELAAVPETAGGLHGHDIYGTGYGTDYPSHNIVHSVEIHIEGFYGRGKYKELPLYFGKAGG